MNFYPRVVPQSGTEGGKRFRNSALAEYQNRKILVSLSEKVLAGRQLKISIRILFKIDSDFVQKVLPIFRIWILGDCCAALAFTSARFAGAPKITGACPSHPYAPLWNYYGPKSV
jgi:hypothetical protein